MARPGQPRFTFPLALLALMLAGCGPDPHEPMAVAAGEGNLPKVQQLLAQGGKPDVTDTGITPLMTASRRGDLATMTALIDAGADLNRQDRWVNGWTPMLHALHKQQRKAVALLLERGANPNQGGWSGETPLMFATLDNDTETMSLLLARGAHAGAGSRSGETALDIAVAGGAFADPTDRSWLGGCYPKAVKLLLEAEPTLKMRDGFGPLWARWWARMKGCSETLDLVAQASRK
jgi:ankyrin repeat protein